MKVMRLEIRSGWAAELPLYWISVISPSGTICASNRVASSWGLPGPVVP